MFIKASSECEAIERIKDEKANISQGETFYIEIQKTASRDTHVEPNKQFYMPIIDNGIKINQDIVFCSGKSISIFHEFSTIFNNIDNMPQSIGPCTKNVNDNKELTSYYISVQRKEDLLILTLNLHRIEVEHLPNIIHQWDQLCSRLVKHVKYKNKVKLCIIGKTGGEKLELF